MKNYFYHLLIIFVLLGSSIFAQTGINFGMRAGYSIGTQYGISRPDLPYTVENGTRHGFSGGIILHFPITESFSVQQEFIYTNKGSRQTINMTLPMRITVNTEYNLNYFEMPILFKYTFLKIKDFEIFGSSGFGLSLLMNGDYSIKNNFSVAGNAMTTSESGDLEGLDEFDYSFHYGIGVDHELFGKTFFFEFRQTVGWNTLMMPSGDPSDPAAPLRNQSYVLTIGLYY